MSWYRKEAVTLFDSLVVSGLFFLDGDLLDRLAGAPWTTGMKCPMLFFSPEMACEIWGIGTEKRTIVVHLFGEMDLPLFGDRDSAFRRAKSIAEQVGYLAHPRGESELEVIGHDSGEHLIVTYDNALEQMTDVKPAAHPMVAPQPILLDEASRARLPKLYSGEEKGLDAVAEVKFFTPDASWTWYATEFDGHDMFFGLVIGYEIELGYFTLSELTELRGPFGLRVERDRFYQPKTLRELQAQHRRERGAG
jgi:hypothetical protein